MTVVATPCSIDDALQLDAARVDVCVLGLSSPLAAAPDADPIGRLHARWPGTQVLVIADHDDDEQLAAYFQRGAAGFVSKRSAPDAILEALDCVALGHRHFPMQPPQFTDSPTDAALPELSMREHTVLRLLAQGLTNAAMSRVMDLSPKTVSSHKMNLQRKLGVRNTALIVPRARELGLL